MNELPIIKLPKTGEKIEFSSCFFHATDGHKASFGTDFSLKYTESHLRVDFNCLDNNFTSQNSLKANNDPLYNQEVFEIFITSGSNDPANYFEIELNPNNAIWLGHMSNPSLGLETVTIEKMLTDTQVGINHSVSVANNSWAGFIEIPWGFLGKGTETNYRVNFYRIRSFKSHTDPNWVCEPSSCDFVCFSSTLSGHEPAFHRPRRFAFLELV